MIKKFKIILNNLDIHFYPLYNVYEGNKLNEKQGD